MAIQGSADAIFTILGETFSFLWAELVLFGLAAVAFLLCIKLQPRGKHGKVNCKVGLVRESHLAKQKSCSPRQRPDHNVILDQWRPSVQGDEVLQVEMAVVVEALRKFGNSSPDVIAELRRGLDENPCLLSSLARLPTVLLKGDAVELLDAVLLLLEEKGCAADALVYSGLMAAQLRRRDYEGAAATAGRLPKDALSPRMHGMLAACAAHGGSLDEALGHLRQMQVPVEGAKIALAPSTVAQILGLAGREHRINAATQELLRVIKACAKERNLSCAEVVFHRLRDTRAALTPLTFNCFLDACVHCGDLARASRLFEEMKQLGHIDVVSYNTMIKVYLSRGQGEQARVLLQEMTARGLQANNVTYNELLHDRVLAKDRKGIWSIIDEMGTAGLRCNPVTCSILLKSLVSSSGPADLRRIILLIDEVEGTIDEVLLCSVIEACIRIRQLDLLTDVLCRYRDSFASLSAPVYGSMIKAYGQAGKVDRVRELWQEMEDHGVEPTSITLGCLTEALVANSLPDEAWELLHKQLARDERRECINTVIYSTVLKGFATSRRMDKVFAVYEEMRSREIACNTITYNTLLDACAKAYAMDRVPGLLDDMTKSGVEADIITYSSIIKGYCVVGDLDRALQILENMKASKTFKPDEIMYNSLLDGCAKQQRVDTALRILDEMKAAGIAPSNYTLSILIKLTGHARRLQQAFRMVEDLSSQNGFKPNIQVYTCLAQACIINKRLDKALAVHDKVVADPACKVDGKFYGALARGCLQLHQPLKSVEVIRAAYQLPGHSLTVPARKASQPAGVDAWILEEVTAKLRSGGREEQQALTSLTKDLYALCGVCLDVTAVGSTRDNRRTKPPTRR